LFIQCANPEDVPPVIATPHHYLINIFRNNLYFVAVLTNERKEFSQDVQTKHCFVFP
jgi:hypothetical protein